MIRVLSARGCSGNRRRRTAPLVTWSLLALSACMRPAPVMDATHHRALVDSLLTLFDSLSAIHRGHPDTGVLRRLHPPPDTIMYVEGPSMERLTGDSLFRRVLTLHGPVREMTQQFPERSGLVLDADHAVLTATEQVDWIDTAGAHRYAGLLTIAVSRVGRRWVIRAYRGT
jgi:hypothetical protein